jgi:hypothetical protein
MRINQDSYNQIKSDLKSFYDGINNVYCPVFKSSVVFNADGFNHLIYRNDRREREKQAQLVKFKILPLAKDLIEITTTFQEYEERLQEVRVKKFKKIVVEAKVIKFWGIIAILNNKKIKAIVRKVGENGQLHFWSVIPGWDTNYHRDIKLITTMKGDPIND